MSIKDRQVKNASERALQEELRAGRFPDSATVSERAAKAFYANPAGEPRFLFTPVSANDISDPDAYNDMLQTIKEDLTIAFDESVGQTQQLMTMANAYETEKQSLQLGLRKLKKRVKALRDKLETPATHQIVQESFDTFTAINFLENTEKEIKRTDSFVDLKNNQVTLPMSYRGATRYDLSQASYTLTPTSTNAVMKAEEIKPFSNALKSTINEAWFYTITKEVLEKTELTVDLTLVEAVEANLLSISLHTPKETSVALHLSSDGQTWRKLKNVTTYDRAEWMFTMPVKYIRFVMAKDEPDHVEGTDMEYCFGAFQVDIRKEVYLPQSFLVSKSHVVQKEIIDSVRLEVEEVIYPQTKIQYFIGLEEAGAPIEWQEIHPSQALYLNQAIKERVDVTPTTAGYGLFQESYNHIPYHSIVNLPNEPLGNRTQVYAGDYMWKVETKATDLLTEEFLPNLNDWNDIRDIETQFLPIEETVEFKEHALTPNSLQRFTTHILMETDEEVYNNEFFIGTAKLYVYLNNSLIKPIVLEEADGTKRFKYTYRFKAGWNKLEILTYFEGEAQPFKPNLYLKDISLQILADTMPLTEISLYDLYNNTGKKDLSYFALDGHSIMVNYNPVSLDVKERGVRYFVQYDYLPPGARQTNEVRMMAVMSRNEFSEQVTPILKSYTLFFE